MVDVHSTTLRWYVFQTRHRAEFITETQLNRQKYGTYVPYEMIDVTRLGVVVGQEKRAYFRSYGFVRFDVNRDHWRPICSTYGVKRLFSTSPEHPICLPEGVVESLQRAMLGLGPEQEIVVEPIVAAISEYVVAEGDEAEVITGIFAGRTGIVQTTKKDRGVLLMDILQEQVPVKFKLSNLRKTDQSNGA
jgi:transcription antitermination factor NusG